MEELFYVSRDYGVKWPARIVGVLCFFASVCVLFSMIWTGLDKNEVVECLTWKQQAEENYKGFYLLKWQWEQCNAHGITIKAHISK